MTNGGRAVFSEARQPVSPVFKHGVHGSPSTFTTRFRRVGREDGSGVGGAANATGFLEVTPSVSLVDNCVSWFLICRQRTNVDQIFRDPILWALLLFVWFSIF